MRDFIVCLFLVALFVAVLFVVGQRDLQLDSIKARMDLIESKLDHGNIPRIEISGRAAVYAGSGSITIAELEAVE